MKATSVDSNVLAARFLEWTGQKRRSGLDMAKGGGFIIISRQGFGGLKVQVTFDGLSEFGAQAGDFRKTHGAEFRSRS